MHNLSSVSCVSSYFALRGHARQFPMMKMHMMMHRTRSQARSPILMWKLLWVRRSRNRRSHLVRKFHTNLLIGTSHRNLLVRTLHRNILLSILSHPLTPSHLIWGMTLSFQPQVLPRLLKLRSSRKLGLLNLQPCQVQAWNKSNVNGFMYVRHHWEYMPFHIPFQIYAAYMP